MKLSIRVPKPTKDLVLACFSGPDCRCWPMLGNIIAHQVQNMTSNANGNRVKKQLVDEENRWYTTWYVRGADGQTVAAYNGGGLLFLNILAGGEIIGNLDRAERRYFVKDHLGSVRTTVDRNGNVVGYDDYYPFGLAMPGRSNNTSNPNDDYKFTGYELDNEARLDLYHANARMYDPVINRFWQIDPLADQFPAWSTYSYTFNNPLRFTDPTGMAPMGDYFNQYGDYLGNDGIDDDKVYQTTDAAVSASEGDWDAVKSSDATSLIGYIGGEIDVSGIYPNLLDRNVSTSKGIGPFAFRDLVKNGGDWDLKSNTNTIFGFASKKNANTRFKL